MSTKLDKKNKSGGLPYGSDIIEIADRLRLKSSERLILLLLRNFMSKKQAFCYPSQKKLAKGAARSERHVRRIISKLVRLNIIFITRKKTGRRINEYRFNFPWNVGENTKQVQKDTDDLLKTGPSCPVQQDTHALCNRTSMSSLKDSTGHSRPFYRINKEKNNPENNSSSSIKQTDDDEENSPPTLIRDDQQTESKIGNEGSLVADDNNLPENYLPPPGAPSMMDFDEFYELYRFAPVDLLKAGRGFNLQNVIEPFKKNEPTDLNKPFAEYLQSQFDDFYATMVSRHWKSGNKPKQGFKVLVHRAAMAGALYLFGWKPRSKEEVEAEKREKERLKAKAREEERRIIEERKKARLEAEEREKMQKEKDTKFLAFISSNPPIELYLSDQGYKSIDRIRIHLKELYDESFWRTPEDLVSFCQHYLREKAVAQVSAKLEKKLLKDKNLLNLFLENGMLSEDYLTDETQLIFDHNGEIEDIARKMVMNRLKLDGFYFEHCLSKLREQAG